MEHFEQSARLFQDVDDPHGYAIATAYVAMVERFRGNLDAALDRYRSALPGLRAAGDLAGEAFALRGIGQVHLEQGNYPAAESYIDQAGWVGRTAGGPRIGDAQVLFWLGMLRLKQEQYGDAEGIFTDVLALTQKLGDPRGQAQALRGLGICYHRNGSHDKAMATLDEALQLVRQPRPSLVESYIRRTMDELHEKLAAIKGAGV
jgi:tetratricopeptide (TPR) repeat protein